MAKRKNGGFELLAAMPWPVPLVLGVIGFVVVRYGIGWAMGSSQNVILAGLGRQLSSSTYAPLAWAVLGICWVAALASYIGAQRRRRLLETQTGLDSIRALSWRQFELLVGEQPEHLADHLHVDALAFPALALHQGQLALLAQQQVDAAVRTAQPGFLHGVALAPERLAHQ